MKRLHWLALACFALAFAFYLAPGSSGAMGFAVFGALFELAAWISFLKAERTVSRIHESTPIPFVRTIGLPVIDRLFVYGTLAPGRPNEHVLANVQGHWQPATVRGRLLQEGWGAAAGFPGIVLDEAGEDVHGLVFSSEELGAHWARLDEFEGEEYERVLVSARLADGRHVDAYIYRLSSR